MLQWHIYAWRYFKLISIAVFVYPGPSLSEGNDFAPIIIYRSAEAIHSQDVRRSLLIFLHSYRSHGQLKYSRQTQEKKKQRFKMQHQRNFQLDKLIAKC